VFEEPYKPHVWGSQHFQNDNGGFAPDNSWSAYWESRGRQIFNAVYFALGLVALFVISRTSEFLVAPALVCAVFFGVLSFGALVYSIFHRYPAGSSDVFSARTQKNLRRFALCAPLVVIIFAGWNCLSFAVIGLWTYGYPGILPQDDIFKAFDARERAHIGLVADISPLNTITTKIAFDQAFDTKHFDQALASADRMIFFNPNDDRWKIRRLGVLGRYPGRESEFQFTTEQYKKSFGNDGYLWNTLADVAVYNKDWATALEMANKHVQIHDKEALAYQQRGAILKELGQVQEAEADEATANSFTINK
jgi:hypothetical protein